MSKLNDRCLIEAIKCEGYCLVQNKETEFTADGTIIGGLFTCPYCGLITEKMKDLKHVFNPSRLLINRLKNGKE